MVYIVLVLYKTTLAHSTSYQSLLKYKDLWSPYAHLLLFNNSPEVKIDSSSDYELYTAPKNQCLAAAYNYALQRAQEGHYKYLLLLDQDTELTDTYFKALSNFFQQNSDDSSYAAIVPSLYEGNQCLSPLSFPLSQGPFRHQKPILGTKEMQTITDKDCVVAFNSVSLLLVEKMVEIGGFDTHYPLDMLDYRYYYQLHQVGAKVALLPVRLQQTLSLNDRQHIFSLFRFESLINSSLRFSKSIGWKSVWNFKITLLILLAASLKRRKKWNRIPFLLRSLFIF